MDIVIKELKEQLAAAQAREKVLRDALLELANLHVVVYNQSPEGRAYMKKLGDLMASTDDTALRAALKAERERIAKHFEPRSYLGSGHQLAVEIRALGDQDV